MRPGTYETVDGAKVKVTETASGGYRLTYPDGTTTVIGGSR